MNRLPFELVNNILNSVSRKDLCSLCQVNSYWHTIGSIKLYRHPLIQTEKELALFKNISQKSQSYIRILDFAPVHQHITDHILSPLLQNTKHLNHINLSKCVDLSPNTIMLLIQNNIGYLHTLKLAGCTLSTEILCFIGEATHSKLTELNLSNTMIKPCVAIDTSNQLESMFPLPRSSSKLNHLDLSYCAWVNSQTVENIAHSVPNLNHIVLQWCNQVRPVSIYVMVEKLSHLKLVDLRHIDSIGTKEQALDIVNHTSSLKEILFTSKRTTTQILLQ